eukprot:Hpha_TRINITY_DN15619_c4_g8::TRINITY_DN15619_c4_g8_i1::g.99400::m.99400
MDAGVVWHKKLEKALGADNPDLMLKVIRDVGRSVTSRDDMGDAPIHWAAGRGALACVQTLLGEGEDVNSANRCASTPLHWAASKGRWEVVTYLVSKGAMGSLDNRLKTPRDRAEDKTTFDDAVEAGESERYGRGRPAPLEDPDAESARSSTPVVSPVASPSEPLGVGHTDSQRKVGGRGRGAAPVEPRTEPRGRGRGSGSAATAGARRGSGRGAPPAGGYASSFASAQPPQPDPSLLSIKEEAIRLRREHETMETVEALTALGVLLQRIDATLPPGRDEAAREEVMVEVDALQAALARRRAEWQLKFMSWNAADVYAWMLVVNDGTLSPHAEEFREQDVTGELLIGLVDCELTSLGIKRLHDRRALLAAVRVLRDEANAAATPPRPRAGSLAPLDSPQVRRVAADSPGVRSPALAQVRAPSEGSRGRSKAPSEPPDRYQCPLTLVLMEDPVMTRTGHNFERKAILEWLRHNDTCPQTRSFLDPDGLFPNLALREEVHDWKRKHNVD